MTKEEAFAIIRQEVIDVGGISDFAADVITHGVIHRYLSVTEHRCPGHALYNRLPIGYHRHADIIANTLHSMQSYGHSVRRLIDAVEFSADAVHHALEVQITV